MAKGEGGRFGLTGTAGRGAAASSIELPGAASRSSVKGSGKKGSKKSNEECLSKIALQSTPKSPDILDEVKGQFRHIP